MVQNCDQRAARKQTELNAYIRCETPFVSCPINCKSEINHCSEKPGTKHVVNKISDILKEIEGINKTINKMGRFRKLLLVVIILN
jgi:hypothetical protein